MKSKKFVNKYEKFLMGYAKKPRRHEDFLTITV
jgi:hypothetical protein